MTTQPQERDIEAAKNAVRDEVGSALCAWQSGRARVCRAPESPCFCEAAARAALRAQPSPREVALEKALLDMRERDDKNGSLPPWYRELLEAALFPAQKGEPG